MFQFLIESASFRTIFPVVCLSLPVIYLFKKYIQVIKHLRPDKPLPLPGPKPFPIRLVGNLFQFSSATDIIQTGFEWSKKYGTCFVLTIFYKNFVVISDAEYAKSVLQSNDLGHLRKPDVYHFLPGINGLAFSSGMWWREMRKNVSTVFSYPKIQTQMDIYNIHANILCQSLSSLKEDKQKQVELELANCSVQMIIGAFISHQDACTYEETMEYVRNWRRFTEITAYRILHPWLGLDIFWKHHAKYPDLIKSHRFVHRFAEILIERYISKHEKSGYAGETCLIAELLSLNYSFENIRSEVVALMFAHETNSLGFYYLLYMLAAHPEHQEKCREEVDQIFANRSDSQVTSHDLSKLKYLERCLLESMRLLPPVYIFGRQLESELTLPNGVNLPIGTTCMVLPAVIHRMAEYYDSPDTFYPDHFLPENTSKRPAYAYLPFSAGPRNCLGMKSSLNNIKVATAKILKTFDITTSVKISDIKFRLNLTMSTKEDLGLEFHRRQ